MRAGTLRLLFTSVICFALAASSQEQTKPAPSPTATVTRADIEAAIKRAESNAGLDANVKARVIGTYDQALTELQHAEESRARTATAANARQSAPETE